MGVSSSKYFDASARDRFKLTGEKLDEYCHVIDEEIDNMPNSVIYTPQFKNWFGDWKNNPQNSSKVVDENGEPLLVHHGSPNFKGDSFNKEKIGNSMNAGESGTFSMTDRYNVAKDKFSYPLSPGNSSFWVKRDLKRPGVVLTGYLNLRHPLDFFNITEKDKENCLEMFLTNYQGETMIKARGLEFAKKYFLDDFNIMMHYDNHQGIKSDIAHIRRDGKTFGEILKEFGYDGLIADMGYKDGTKEYQFLYPNQFKSIDNIQFSNNDSFLKEDEEVDLSSFRPQNELNPKIWPHNILNSKVRLRLLDIADDFINTLEVDWAKPKDIILTGSLANYNWSKFSDFDLHILMDFNEVDERTNFVKDYFDSKKSLWNEKHENLKIYGFPVEIYVQDINENHTASGIYSLYKNKWIKTPERDNIKAIKLDKFLIKEKSIKIMKQINALENAIINSKDEYEFVEIAKKAKALFDKIKSMRRESLKNGNEMSVGNLIFKFLRRFGYIGKLVSIKNDTYDKIYSIK